MHAPRPLHGPNVFIPNLQVHGLLQRFFISAIGAILLLRLYLYLTGFPQVGGKGLHVAHTLWGGLLMLIALVLVVSYLDRAAHAIAAIVGGAGFGLFIDEVGKFVTSNTNYFFKPAVSIIYVVFVLMYLAFLELSRHQRLTPTGYAVNALHEIQAVLLNDDPVKAEFLATAYITRLVEGAVPTALGDLLGASAQEAHARAAGRMQRSWVSLRGQVEAMLQHNAVQNLVLLVLVLLALGSIAEALVAIGGEARHLTVARFVQLVTHPTFTAGTALLSAGISGVLILVGLLAFPVSRRRAIQVFEYGVLVSVLVTQVFIFDFIQFWALAGFTIDVVLLATLSEMRVALIARDNGRLGQQVPDGTMYSVGTQT